MAQGKKSFVLYCDQRGVFDKLPDEVAGKLIKHIFSYVNDEHPATDDILITIAFEAIQAQLKRDLKKWEKRAEISRVNGLKGGRPKTPEEPEKTHWVKKEPRKPVNVNDNVTVNVNDNVIEHSSSDEQRVSFNDFWDRYDHKVDKQKAQKKWNRLSKSDQSAIMEHLDKYIPNTFKDKYPTRRNPTTYLNNRTWENEVIALPKEEEKRPSHILPTPADLNRVMPGVFEKFTS